MSVLFNPFAKFWRKKSTSIGFKDDESGIVTVQMVMFSVIIFGGIGLMMDFGRAYSAHSQMQGYIDQVALAAAQQLDGKSDSISRATAAANAVSKNSAFVTGDGSFSLSSITFMVNSPTDANGEFSKSLAATHNTTQPELAKFVMARATSASVSAKMLNFASSTGGLTEINIEASAVATSRRVTCGGLTPMVMCNPYETATDTSWQQEISNGIGYRMKLTANDPNGGKPSNADANGGFTQIRLGMLKTPETLMNVRNTVCTNTSLLPGATSSSSSEMRKDICLLASIEAGLSCVNDQVAYKTAHPEAITTGLGVVFDMYDDSIADVLYEPFDPVFTHSFPSSLGWASDIERSSLFYPDIVSGHGRMNREQFDIHLNNQEYVTSNTVYNSQNAFLNNFIVNGKLANIDAQRAAYGTPSPNTIPSASRLNHPFETGKRSEWGPAPARTCLEVENCDTTQGSSYPTIYRSSPGVNEVENYAAALYGPYLLRQADAANPGVYPNWYDASPSIDVTPLVNGHTTYYSFYSNVERVNTDLHASDAIAGHDREDASGAHVDVDYKGDTLDPDTDIEFDDDDVHYGTAGTQVGPVNYTSVYGAIPAGSEERRVQRVTVVNCEAAETYAAATGDASSGFNDTYMGEVVDVVDLFMVTPPQVTECFPIVSDDPDSNFLCPNNEVTEVNLDVELVNAASINSVDFDARFYAVLVH